MITFVPTKYEARLFFYPKLQLIMAQNDPFAVTRKILYNLKDAQIFVPHDSIYKKTYNPHQHTMLNSETYSFIADWQLPPIEKNDHGKSCSQ